MYTRQVRMPNETKVNGAKVVVSETADVVRAVNVPNCGYTIIYKYVVLK
jgi:hypothetical protein